MEEVMPEKDPARRTVVNAAKKWHVRGNGGKTGVSGEMQKGRLWHVLPVESAEGTPPDLRGGETNWENSVVLFRYPPSPDAGRIVYL
jgi:hypothetical protein